MKITGSEISKYVLIGKASSHQLDGKFYKQLKIMGQAYIRIHWRVSQQYFSLHGLNIKAFESQRMSLGMQVVFCGLSHGDVVFDRSLIIQTLSSYQST